MRSPYKIPDTGTYPDTMAPDQGTTKQLDAVLGYLVGRRLSTREVCAALGLSRSTYYEQRDQGRLITADNLITAARNLRLNPVDLLVRYGLIPASAAVDYAGEITGTSGALTWAPTRTQTKKPPYDPNAPGL
jgi:hypothetical protein